MGDTPTPLPTWKIVVATAAAALCVVVTVCLAWPTIVSFIAPRMTRAPAAPTSAGPRGTGTIRGTVRDKNGTAVAGARLMALISLPATGATDAPELSFPDRLPETTSGPDGSYVFTDLPDMDMSILGSGSDGSILPVHLDQFRVHPDCIVDLVLTPAGEERTVGDFERRTPDPSRTFTVRIVDASGKSVSPDSVKYAIEGTGWSSHGDAELRKRADGWLSVEIPTWGSSGTTMAPNGESVRRCLLVFSSVEFGRRVVDVPPPPAEPIEVKVEAPALLEVVVGGDPAAPPSTGLSVDVDDGRGASLSFAEDRAAHGTIDATGRERLGPLAPGGYELSVSDGGYPRRVIQHRHVDLVSGANHATIPLGDACCTLTVVGGVERKFWFVTLRPRGERTTFASEQIKKTGRVVFAWLTAGPYDVEIDGETRHVDVAANTTLTW